KQLVAAIEAKNDACKAAEEARNLATANQSRKLRELSDALSLVREELDDSSEDLEVQRKTLNPLSC
ncbi:hypothetical protein MKW92_001174, partial [Papaver armeniacum]